MYFDDQPGLAPRPKHRYRAERRVEPRESYPVIQRLSFGRDAEGQEQAWYFARCHNLSASGLSFWSNQTLPTESFLVELGCGEETVAVSAQVRYVNPITCLFNDLYLVGCQFVDAPRAAAPIESEPQAD